MSMVDAPYGIWFSVSAYERGCVGYLYSRASSAQFTVWRAELAAAALAICFKRLLRFVPRPTFAEKSSSIPSASVDVRQQLQKTIEFFAQGRRTLCRPTFYSLWPSTSR